MVSRVNRLRMRLWRWSVTIAVYLTPARDLVAMSSFAVTVTNWEQG